MERQLDYSRPQYVRPGDEVRLLISYSEAAMHLQVAGRVFGVRVEGRSDSRATAQLISESGNDYSFPITMGEAGFYWDGERQQWYFYPVKPVS